MTRLIKHVRNQPFKAEKDGVTMYICGCGLTKNLPYCDGSHKKTKDESENALYFYDVDGNRIEFDSDSKVPDSYLP